MVDAVYHLFIDTRRDGNFDGTIDEVTSRLIGQATWNIGMDSPQQSFANPARLNVTLDNFDGAFNPDTLGAELLTNGTFAAWTGDNPDSWTVTGEVASDPEISQVGQSELHDGTGTGAANFYSTVDPVSLTQAVLTVGTSYMVTLDISASAESTGSIALFSGATQVSPAYHLGGNYTVYFNATSTDFIIASSGVVNMTVNTVSVKATSLYGKLVSEGVLGYFYVTIGGLEKPQFYGKLTSINLTPGSIGRRTVSMIFSDPMLDLLDAEYIPPLYTNVTADVPMIDLIESPVAPYPYASSYWMMGIQGSSELEVTTWLYDPQTYVFDTGIQTFSYVGDNSMDGKKQGVSAQSFLRDLVEGEVGGRFFFTPASSVFTFHNRHRDTLNTTVVTTFTDTGDPSFEADLSTFIKTPVINHSTVSYQPRAAGDAGSVIWEHNGNLDMGKITHKFTVRYRDNTNPDARIGASAVIAPLAGTDYIAQNISSGEDCTASMTVSIVAGANSAEVTLINPNNFNVRFSLLRIRGTPLTTFEPATTTSINGDSIHDYRYAPEPVNYRLIDNQIDAQSIADYRVYKNSTPIAVFDKLGYIKTKTDARMAAQITNTIGERITITDAWLGHSTDYFVVGYRHSITWGADGTHTTTYTLKSADKENFWVLGTSLLGTGTRLAL